jgi:hypothetical protein
MPPIQNCPNCSARSISRRRILFSRGFADLCDRCGARVRLRPSWMRWFAAFALSALVSWVAVAQWHWSHWAGVLAAMLAAVVASWTWLALADVPLDVRD